MIAFTSVMNDKEQFFLIWYYNSDLTQVPVGISASYPGAKARITVLRGIGWRADFQISLCTVNCLARSDL